MWVRIVGRNHGMEDVVGFRSSDQPVNLRALLQKLEADTQRDEAVSNAVLAKLQRQDSGSER